MKRLQTILRHQFSRNIYVPKKKTNKSATSLRPNKPVKSWMELDAQQENLFLDRKLNEIKEKQQEMLQLLDKDREIKAKEKLVKADISIEASDEEVNKFEAQINGSPITTSLSIGNKTSTGSSLPSSVKVLLQKNKGKNEVSLFSQKQDWASIITSLPPLNNLPSSDIEQLMFSVPLKQRSQLVSVFERIVDPSVRTQKINDIFMSCYAELGQVEMVENILAKCSNPTVYSYSHLCKAHFKNRADTNKIMDIVKKMESMDLRPNLTIMSIIMQSFIQQGNYEKAIQTFDNLKYMSVDTQPDVKMYNTMILCYAKQYNINKSLDLFEEMRTRRPYPIEPNGETYNYMLYACARDPKMHMTAWNYFIELQSQKKLSINKQSFYAMMYLCGNSGELLLARALIRKLAERGTLLIDDFVVNCLLNAYYHWDPNVPSKILNSSIGHRIRDNILTYTDNFDDDNGIPLLPTVELNREIVLTESNSVFEYFADLNKNALFVQRKPSPSTIPALVNFLKVSLKFSPTIDEFKRRFNRFTEFSQTLCESTENRRILPPSETAVSSEKRLYLSTEKHPKFVVKRDQNLYILALKAAIKFKDLSFGKSIWEERGSWRKLPDFRNLPQKKQSQYDFQFARTLVELLAECGRIEEAIQTAASAITPRPWTHFDLAPLISKCEEIEDHESISMIKNIIKKSKAKKRTVH